MVRGVGTAGRLATKRTTDDDWSFVRRLTPVVSSFMRQVVTPPTMVRRRMADDVRRIERVSFHVHVVDVSNQWNDDTGEEEEEEEKEGAAVGDAAAGDAAADKAVQSTRRKRKRRRKKRKESLRKLRFDMNSFKQQVSSLRAPDQEFSFTFQRVDMSDDPSLASAYYTSMRHSVVPDVRRRTLSSSQDEASSAANKYDVKGKKKKILPGHEACRVPGRGEAPLLAVLAASH